MTPSPSHRAAGWLHRLVRRVHRVEAHGLERVPSRGRVIIAMNHVGLGVRSGLLLSSLLERNITFLASTVMRRLPLSRQLASTFPVLFVSPADMLSTRLLDEADAVLGRGDLLGLMVDGREMDQRKGVTKRGAAWLAVRLGASLLPVSMRFGLTGLARVRVGEPLPPPSSASRQDLDASTAALHDFHREMSR
jgi:1-acyl-sn-glycerol-3-phosphate acyltransferase